MATPDEIKIMDKMRLADLTVGEFKALVREIVEEIVQQAVFELEQQLADPDEGKEFKPEFAQELHRALTEKGKLHTLEEVKRELGLDE